MKKSIGSVISLVLVIIIFIASLGGCIYANVMASEQKAIVEEQTKAIKKYDYLIEKIENSDNAILQSPYFANIYKGKLKDATLQNSLAKSQMKKYIIFSAVLMFVALAMIVCIIAMVIPMSKKRKKLYNGDSEEAEKLEEVVIENPQKEISDFDSILNAIDSSNDNNEL